mgnify:CR=1 FL=1
MREVKHSVLWNKRDLSACLYLYLSDWRVTDYTNIPRFVSVSFRCIPNKQIFLLSSNHSFFLMNLKCVYTSTSYFEVVHTLTMMTLPQIILRSTFVTVSPMSTCFQNVDAPWWLFCHYANIRYIFAVGDRQPWKKTTASVSQSLVGSGSPSKYKLSWQYLQTSRSSLCKCCFHLSKKEICS